jgi:membrane fusion protein (multidrug efflux system)
MKKNVLMVVGGVIALLVVVWGFSKWSYGRSHVSTDNAQVGGHLVPVMAKVGGYVKTVSVSENDHVTQGQLLVEINPDELKERVSQAEADLAAAQASAGGGNSTGQAGAQVEQAQRQRSALGAQIDAARANAEKADHDLERIKGLADKQIVSKQQLDAARAAAEAAHAAVNALLQQQGGASASITGAQAGVKLAQARVQSARSALDNARLQLSYATITAPVSGIVSKRNAEPGQLLQSGQPVLTIVADTGTYVNANFKETQLAQIRPGEEVTFDVDAYGSCDAKGLVESISAATGSQFSLLPTDNASGNFTKVVQRVPVRIHVTEGCGRDKPLRPGMSVEVHVKASK